MWRVSLKKLVLGLMLATMLVVPALFLQFGSAQSTLERIDDQIWDMDGCTDENENLFVVYSTQDGMMFADYGNGYIENAVKVSDEDLNAVIKTYNESRTLLEKLFDLRKRKAPPLTGTDVMNVILAAITIPREPFNELLSSLLKEAENREGISDYKARIMLAGTLLDDPDYIKIIEDLGGLVVTDSLCIGTRAFAGLVDEDSNPIEALAERYFSKVACPRMAGSYPGRVKFLMDQIKEFDVDGVIIQRMKFCPMGWGESYMFAKDLKAQGIPCLELEKEYVLSGTGAMKTRVQAFLETLEGR